MNENIFQEVFDLLQGFMPQNWTKTILFAGYTEGSYSMKYYCRTENGTFTDCFSIDGVSRADLLKLFVNIDKILFKERASLDDNRRWSVLTMIIDSDGKMRTEFDYDDHSEDMLAYEKEWKKKYLYN